MIKRYGNNFSRNIKPINITRSCISKISLCPCNSGEIFYLQLCDFYAQNDITTPQKVRQFDIDIIIIVILIY